MGTITSVCQRLIPDLKSEGVLLTYRVSLEFVTVFCMQSVLISEQWLSLLVSQYHVSLCVVCHATNVKDCVQAVHQ